MSRAATSLKARELAERIASRDKNNLYLTSRFFADRRRFDAFCGLYAPMRVVDDRVDETIAESDRGSAEREAAAAEVDSWEELVVATCEGRPLSPAALARVGGRDVELLLIALAEAQARFPVPPRLWANFFSAMRRDLAGDGFVSYSDFLNYAEGATVAPTTIYLILITAQPGAESRFALPRGFDVFDCGRNLGLFAYLVHILRDLPDDLAAGRRGLVYLAAEDLERFGLGRDDLRNDLARRRASEPLRRLLTEIGDRAERHLSASEASLAFLSSRLPPDCCYVLQLIVEVYRALLARLAAAGFDPFLGIHQLSLAEKEAIAERLARRMKVGAVETPD